MGFESDEEWAAGKSTRLPRGDQDRRDRRRDSRRRDERLLPLPPRRRGAARAFSAAGRHCASPPGEREVGRRRGRPLPCRPRGCPSADQPRPTSRFATSWSATRPSPEAVEYPDTRQISVMAFTESQLGTPALGHAHAGRLRRRSRSCMSLKRASSVASVFFDAALRRHSRTRASTSASGCGRSGSSAGSRSGRSPSAQGCPRAF